MFFIGIFGVETKNVELKPLPATMCKHCRGTEKFTLFKHYRQFHFFFIPLWKWRLEYYIVCDTCQTIAKIPLEKGRALEADEKMELTLWDQEIVYTPSENKRRCHHCHEVVDATYQYCPHCGNHLA